MEIQGEDLVLQEKLAELWSTPREVEDSHVCTNVNQKANI